MGLNDKYRETDQHERAYQKQDAIFVAKKRVIGAKRGKSMRYVKVRVLEASEKRLKESGATNL